MDAHSIIDLKRSWRLDMNKMFLNYSHGVVSVRLLISMMFLVIVVSLLQAETTCAQSFIRGDVNSDGVVNDDDICALECYIHGEATCSLTGAPCSSALMSCFLAADVDDNGSVNLSDLTYLYLYLHSGGSQPSAPFPTCGVDPTDPQPGNDCCGFIRGDANGDAAIDISDAVYLIAYIFSGGPAPNPLLAGDANCDSTVDISDAVYLIAYIFSGGPEPCAGCK
jgi:hypothetical protein